MITFACECGKALRVADEHAGKRSKCPACATPLVVPKVSAAAGTASSPAASTRVASATTTPRKPVAPAAAPARPKPRPAPQEEPDDDGRPYNLDEAPAGRPCPNCRKPLPSADATFCVKCGFNLATGQKATFEAAVPTKAKAKAKKPSRLGQFLAHRLTSRKFLGGLASLVGGAVWLVVGLMANRLFFYPIFLVIAGFLGMIAGLISGDD